MIIYDFDVKFFFGITITHPPTRSTTVTRRRTTRGTSLTSTSVLHVAGSYRYNLFNSVCCFSKYRNIYLKNREVYSFHIICYCQPLNCGGQTIPWINVFKPLTKFGLGTAFNCSVDVERAKASLLMSLNSN